MSVSSIFIVGLIALATFQEGLAGTCGGNFTDAAGTFKSPGFPIEYENNMDCYWFISPNKTSAFYIRSLFFETEACCDKVTVSVRTSAEVKQLLVVSGDTPLSVALMIDRGDVVIVHFHTDVSNVYTGFRLVYSTPDHCPESAGFFECNDGLMCVRSELTCDGVKNCLDGSDEWGPMCRDGCRNETLYHCANGQCVVGPPCDGIVECDDQSDESQGCLVSEGIVVGDSLQATVDFRPSQLEIRVSLCSDDLCKAIILYGLSPDRQSLAFESFGQCSNRSCDDNSLETYNYPSGWTPFVAATWQFYVSIREESLSVGWNNASSDDAILPITSVSGKRLLIHPLASTTWINQTTEDPSSLSTESTTPASTAPTSTITTTTFGPTYTSTGRFTVITTQQPAATTTTPASSTGWTTITPSTSRPTVRTTVISTSTTQASSTSSTPTPVPSAGHRCQHHLTVLLTFLFVTSTCCTLSALKAGVSL